MAQTNSAALSAAITFKVQRKVLQNLRARLVWADASLAEKGTFQPGIDTLTFVSVPDLSINTTALTEGTTPSAKALSINTVTLDTEQYGDLVEITDLAKVKSPIEIVDIASERVSRQAAESIDQITRDVIAAGGTVAYQGSNTTRAGIGAGENVTASDIMKLRARMFAAKVPLPDDGYYKLFVSPNVAYDMRADTTNPGGFLDVNRYARPEQIMRGEVGRYHGFRVMEVVNAPTFASTVTVHASIAVGALKGWGAGELQTLRTYHVPPGGDHDDPLAQRELVGWKVNFGVAVLSNSFYFRLESAASDL